MILKNIVLRGSELTIYFYRSLTATSPVVKTVRFNRNVEHELILDISFYKECVEKGELKKSAVLKDMAISISYYLLLKEQKRFSYVKGEIIEKNFAEFSEALNINISRFEGI